MRILVTGGAGFIGSNVAAKCLKQGHQVRILDNLSSGNRRNLEALPDAEFIQGDIRDMYKIRQASDGVDTIFHLAASVGNKRSIDYPIEDSEVNVIGTLRILEAAKAAKVRKLVFSSSAGIFGELKTLPIKEDHPVEPDSPYGASKLAAEKLCLSYSKLYPLECVCFRYFNVFGINQRYDAYGNVIPIFVDRALTNHVITIYGDGEQTRDFINVEDVAQANYDAAMSIGTRGAFNLGSAARISINKLAFLVKELSGSKVEIIHAPPRPGDVRHSLADISAAQRAFGFSPTVDFEQGLAAYIAWARNELDRKNA